MHLQKLTVWSGGIISLYFYKNDVDEAIIKTATTKDLW